MLYRTHSNRSVRSTKKDLQTTKVESGKTSDLVVTEEVNNKVQYEVQHKSVHGMHWWNLMEQQCILSFWTKIGFIYLYVFFSLRLFKLIRICFEGTEKHLCSFWNRCQNLGCGSRNFCIFLPQALIVAIKPLYRWARYHS